MLVYILFFVALFAFELLYFAIARRFGIVDLPNGRSSHEKPALRGGGVIFTLAVMLWSAVFGMQYPWFLGGLVLIAAVSFADDIRSLPVRFRLLAQFAATGLMFVQFSSWSQPCWWLVPLMLVVCVGVINAFNFMDGINGITGGYALAVLIPLYVLNAILPDGLFIDPSFLLCAILSVLVFCFFNFRTRARCFAGDAGSVGIAFVIVFALGALILRSGDPSYIALIAVYGVDSVLTIIHRIMLGENLGEAHRKHAYQLMANELGIPHVLVSLIYMLLQSLVSLGLMLVPSGITWHLAYLAVVLLLLTAAYLIFMKKYYHLHQAYLNSLKDKE